MTKPTGRPRGRPRKSADGAAPSPAAIAASAAPDGADAPDVATLAPGYGPDAPDAGGAPSGGRGRGRPAGGETRTQLAGTLAMALGMLSVFGMMWLCRPDRETAEAAALTADEAGNIAKPLASLLWKYVPQRRVLKAIAGGEDWLSLGAGLADYGMRVYPLVQAAQAARAGVAVDAGAGAGTDAAPARPARRRPAWTLPVRRPAPARRPEAGAGAAESATRDGGRYGPLGPILGDGDGDGQNGTGGGAYPAHFYAH